MGPSLFERRGSDAHPAGASSRGDRTVSGARSSERQRAAEIALAAAREAALVVMRVYAPRSTSSTRARTTRSRGPTARPTRSSASGFARAFPGAPIVAEESDPADYAGFAGAEAAWFVDPLDGTREFVEHNGEFAVMIGLAERGRATLGVIVAPAWERSFVGIAGEGAWEVAADGSRTPIRVSARAHAAGALDRPVAVAHAAELASPWRRPGRASRRPHGSAGLKGALVATGAHDVYVQPGRAGMRWDACATEALVRAAGGG